MSMSIETVFGFVLVALVILIKLVLLALALILIGQYLFGCGSPIVSSERNGRPPSAGD